MDDYSDDPKFNAWMKQVNRIIRKHSGGLGVFDFADAMWRDLYDESEGRIDETSIIETLCEADDIFAAMIEER